MRVSLTSNFPLALVTTVVASVAEIIVMVATDPESRRTDGASTSAFANVIVVWLILAGVTVLAVWLAARVTGAIPSVQHPAIRALIIAVAGMVAFALITDIVTVSALYSFFRAPWTFGLVAYVTVLLILSRGLRAPRSPEP
ncbi:MAG TPA: hypothetical protein VK139_06235 [Microbacteriaceae bacterium]|nr:hypothetical protein [Microbacteriaceae bacterium]